MEKEFFGKTGGSHHGLQASAAAHFVGNNSTAAELFST